MPPTCARCDHYAAPGSPLCGCCTLFDIAHEDRRGS